jgi:Tol biopolymer transport system component
MGFIRILVVFLLFSALLIPSVDAHGEVTMRAAFVRDGALWLKIGEKEQRITREGRIRTPVWSADGNWIAYEQRSGSWKESSGELWVYHLPDGKKYRVAANGAHPMWSPTLSILAFQSDSVLYMVDLRTESPRTARRMADGIDRFSWLPNGQGWLVSSAAEWRPEGWTQPLLQRILFHPETGHHAASVFFKIPNPVRTRGKTYLAVETSAFSWSNDGRWVAFAVKQTPSMSADSNVLCVLSADGKDFLPIGEVLAYEDWWAWAPRESVLAYVEGGDRMAQKQKRLHVIGPPFAQGKNLSAAGYSDQGVAWLTDRLLLVPRVVDREWVSDPGQRPLPSISLVSVPDLRTRKISAPPRGAGDFAPQAFPKAGVVAWVRTNRVKAEVWLAKPDGSGAHRWIDRIDPGVPYYDHWEWREVLSLSPESISR